MAWYGYKRLYSGGPVVDVGLEITSLTRNQNSVSFSARVELKVISGGMWDQTGNARLGLTGCGEQSVSYRISQGGSQSWNFSGSVSASPTATSASLYSWFSGSEFTGNNSGDSWSISFEKYGTDPSGLTATLSDVGPDWADIAVSISSYGNPSTSANRYIEAAILGSSTYGGPYRYKTKTAVTSNTFTVDNSGSGNLTIAPNTQYHYGGYADNTVRSTSTVTGTFVTLPAKPTLTAVGQGHGQIDFTVSHATEGSAKTVTEEYSTDGGITWTAITGGAFTLTLATQTEVIVRRISDAGESSETVTVTPTFTNGIYASVNRVSTAVKHIYAQPDGFRRLVSILYSPRDLEDTFFASFDENVFIDKVNSDATLKQAGIDGATIIRISVYFTRVSGSGIAGTILIHYVDSGGNLRTYIPWDTSPADTAITTARMAEWGLVADFSGAPSDIGRQQFIPLISTYSSVSGAAKIRKVYASVNGKTTLVFEDVS